jgi:hypothetical protein
MLEAGNVTAIRTLHLMQMSKLALLDILPKQMALPDAMAEMIPDTLPASSTAGERRVFATLARLPDDCLIYYEPVVRRRYPYLIAILPEVGVLVIEVKDWRLAELGGVVLLIARAKLLVEDPKKRILILCYNRLLAQHLAVRWPAIAT